ncbi:MAG: hypothetical protein LBQ64_03825 [Bacteroidales bacterium]|nr:hypothetical protein [Bacteroidales bacterium]
MLLSILLGIVRKLPLLSLRASIYLIKYDCYSGDYYFPQCSAEQRIPLGMHRSVETNEKEPTLHAVRYATK